MAHHIVTLPGDGIGPEIIAPTLEVLRAVGEFDFEEHLFGGASIDAHGSALTDEVLDACRRADAVLLAAVGEPEGVATDPRGRGVSGTPPPRGRRGRSRASWACPGALGSMPTRARSSRRPRCTTHRR